MKFKVSRADVLAADIEDRPGGLADKLEPLAKAGANLEFVIARRAPDKPGKGVVFVTPIKGAAQLKAAKEAGFAPAGTMCSVRIEGIDKPGLGAKITRAVADAGINMRGCSAASIGKRFVSYIAFDNSSDATKAMRVLKRLC